MAVVLNVIVVSIFFFKQKTAYEMRISDWSSDVCSSDLSVKLLLYKLSETQYRSMARMKIFGPKIKDIRERYADDRERLQKAMMDLYKKEGFNPLAGCWPMLVDRKSTRLNSSH